MASDASFVHLHVHSQYSLLDGVSHFGPLCDEVKKKKMDSIALTDHGNLFGAVAFYKACEEAGIKPIIGSEVYVSPTTYTDRSSEEAKNHRLHLVLLAEDLEGYHNLSYLISKGYLEGFYRKPRIDKELLAAHNKGLIALSGCLSGVVARYLQGDEDPKKAWQNAGEFADIMGPERFYIELMDHGMDEQKKVNQKLIEIARKNRLPMVATNDAHYLKRRDADTQDILIAIATNKTVDDETRLSLDTQEVYLKSPEEMQKLFGNIEGAMENTLAIAERCNVKIKFRGDLSEEESLLPRFETPDGSDVEAHLRRLVEEGLKERYGEIDEMVRKRYEHEMHIITSMGFVSYFLVVADFVQYAIDNKIPTGCRGSGAGSIVAYALGITDLDPIKYKLFFERFLNPERVSMPDFDIDLCQMRRGEVIEYVREKYGAENVAHIITFGTMKAKAAVRDIGRVKGLELGFVDKVAKLIPAGPKVTVEKSLEESPELREMYEADVQVQELLDEAKKIEGTVRQPGIHAAGVVVCRKPLIEAVPLYKPAGKDDVLTQYNMNEVEELGLLKIDFLGLKNLTIIADCMDLVKQIHGVEIDWKTIGFDDPATYALLQRGDGFGVFQVESAGMRDMLQRALPTDIEDITALIALYRPGPMQFMDSFIARKHGREEVTYAHPDMEEPLKETFGLMIYQEQVMQVANVLAGFSLGEADILRRAMSKKKADQMAKMKAQFVAGCADRTISEDVANQVFMEIEKFASYGFNKAHAASYAVLTYRTAYLKAHYPAEYMAALLTGEIRTGASDKLGMYIGVTREMGLKVLQPHINYSDLFFTVVEGDIRFGLAAIKNVGQGPVSAILEERESNGPFESFQDFCARVDLGRVGGRAVECLIIAGCFDGMEGTRPQLLAIMKEAMEVGTANRDQKMSGQVSLFEMLEEGGGDSFNSIPLPALPDWSDREKFEKEKELAGIFLSGHPLDRFAADIRSFAQHTSASLLDVENDSLVRLVGMVTNKREILTHKGEPMAFVELEDLEGRFEATFFPRTYKECRDLIVLDATLYVKGKRSMRPNEDKEPKVLVDRAELVEDLRRKYAKTLDITLPAQEIELADLETLRGLLRDHQGKLPVRIQLAWNGNGGGAGAVVVEVDKRFKVNPTDFLLRDLSRMEKLKNLRFGVR